MARTTAKVARTKAKKVNAVSKSPVARDVESRVIKLAEQLGTLAGTMQRKADGVMDSEAVKRQMAQIRDGAAAILDQVNRAGTAAGESAIKLAKAARASIPGAAATLAELEKRAAEEAKRARSRTLVAAPGKKHRKPPPQVKVDRHAAQPATAPVILKPMPNRMRRGVR